MLGASLPSDAVIGFVTSLPHPDNCASYPNRSRLLARTLRSILGQRAGEARVVVVANRPPAAELPDDPRIELVLVPFPPSSSPIGQPTAVTGIYEDKGAKLAVGAGAATRAGATHVMFVDSDDFVHRDIAGLVAEEPRAAGWFSDAGYFHAQGARTVTRLDHGFHQRNGSTHIIRTDLLAVPGDLDPGLARDEVLDRLGRDRTIAIMGRHRPICEHFASMGSPLAALPFPSAVWEIGTGENFSRVLAASGNREPVKGTIAATYGLELPSHPSAAVAGARGLVARAARRFTERGGR